MTDEIVFEESKTDLIEDAAFWWQRGYAVQMRGELDEAIRLYTRSLEIYPTAEAYTYRGWAKSFQGKLDEAIEECHQAIAVDPDFGNPYNDIGAYLIQQGNYHSAIPWLEKAIQARRYECYFYPWFNLGRVYEKQRRLIKAMNCYKRACDLKPDYAVAVKNYRRLQAVLS